MSGPYAPGVAEAVAATSAPKTESAPVGHNSFFLDGKPRTRAIVLEYPLSFDGREWREIHLRRLTLGEVGRYVDRLAEINKSDPDRVVRFPVFVDHNGADLPDGLWDALDDDDVNVLNAAALDFLPRRFRAETKPAISDSPTSSDGGLSEPSSVAPSAGASLT